MKNYYIFTIKTYIFAEEYMNLPKIFNPGVYRHRQVGHHMVVPHFWISLNVSGLVRSINYDMDGNLLSSYEHTADSRPHQLLSIGVPGFWSDFEYDSTRENWVIFLEWNALSYDKKNRKILLDYDGVQLELPLSIPLQPSETESLRNQFNTIREYHNSGIPGNQLSAAIMIQSIFLRFLTQPAGVDDTVELLRKRIDNDEKWEKSISAHCREMGICRDTVRTLFTNRYKIPPGEYRLRKRLQKVLNLFAYSNLSLKEIAFETGMKNATHLNSLIRKYYGRTPSALRREYCGGKTDF